MKIQVNDISIHYEIDGPEKAPVIACSHCLSGSLHVWDDQVRMLKDKYRVLRFDTRGHGESSAPEGPYTMEMLSDDVIGLFDALGIERAHFMGISMGGMMTQTLALNYPERFLSLILCDTAAAVPKEAAPIWADRIRTAEEKGMAALADDTINRWLSPPFQEKHPEIVGRIRKMILNTPVPGFAGCSHAISRFDVADRLPQLDLPVLIMVGENDPGTPVESARQIRDRIHNAELAVLPRAYHLSNIEAAAEFNKGLSAFLAAQ